MTHIKNPVACDPCQLRARDFLLTNKSGTKYNLPLLGPITCSVKGTVFTRKTLGVSCVRSRDLSSGQQLSFRARSRELESFLSPCYLSRDQRIIKFQSPHSPGLWRGISCGAQHDPKEHGPRRKSRRAKSNRSRTTLLRRLRLSSEGADSGAGIEVRSSQEHWAKSFDGTDLPSQHQHDLQADNLWCGLLCGGPGVPDLRG